MPTLAQLPQVTSAGTADLLPISQGGATRALTVSTLLSSTQPALSMPAGTVLGRSAAGSGAPQALALGNGLSISNGVLSASGTVYAPLDSPAFTGTPTAPTPPASDASNALATTAFVQAHVGGAGLVTLAGDIAGSGAGVITATLPIITTPGSYAKVTVNAKGQVTAGGTLLPGDITGLATVASSGRFSDLSGPLPLTDASLATVTAPVQSGVARSLSAKTLDFFNALDFGAVADGVTGTGAAITTAIAAAASRPSGGEVYLPAGVYRIDLSTATIFARSGVVLRGAGRGKTVLIADDLNGTGGTNGGNAAVTNAGANASFPLITDFHVRDLTVQGKRGQNGTNTTAGAFLVQLHNVSNISVEDCEFLDARGFSLGIIGGSDVWVRANRVLRSNFDSIAVWDVSNAVITDNQIEMSGDDAISVHTNDTTTAPLRAAVVISNNTITDSRGIHVLGAKSVTISGNIVRRANLYGIHVGFDSFFHQGNTPLFGVQIVNNTIEDVYDPSGYISGSVYANYIWVAGSSKQAATGPSVPGIPLPSTGVVTPLLGANSGNFYANAQSNTDGSHPVTGNTPSPGGYWVRVEGNTLVRTLPAVSSWSLWGYGSTVQVGIFGAYNGAITETMLNHPGIHIAAALRHSRVAGNIIQTTGTGIEFDANISDMDFDGLDIIDNRIADFGQFGIFWATSSVANHRIRIAGNDFDGDPYFKSSGRGGNGTWQTTGSPSTGIYVAFLSGTDIESNHFRNVKATVVQSGNAQNNLRRNVVHCSPAVIGYSAANQGVGTLPAAGDDYTHVIETCDPTDPNYGRIKSATLYTAAAQPTTGTYVTGHFVASTVPSVVSGQAFLGWKRLTTSSTHSNGTDWAPVYGAAGAALPNAALVGSNGSVLSGVTVGGGLSLSQGTLSAGALTVPSASLVGGNGAVFTGVSIGSGLALQSGTLSATGTGGGGGVSSIVTSGLLTGGTITASGTIGLAAPAAGIVQSNGTTLSAVTVGSGLAFAGGTLSSTAGGGSVTSVATGTGLTGGPITGAGTITLSAATTSTLGGIIVGSGLAASAGTVSLSGAVTSTYTSSGAIAVNDNVALINAASAVAMTLASGAADGHVLIVKRFGSGAVNVTATIDGVAGNVISMSSASLKEAVTLTWSNALSSWLLV